LPPNATAASDRRALDDVYKRRFAWPSGLAEMAELPPGDGAGLLDVVTALRPTVLIGTSGTPGSFDESVIRRMAAGCQRPTTLPFSNPTSQSEAVPGDLLDWTEGRALVATGSPFAPVTVGGRTHRVGQGNNVYVFPGVGLGALVAEASEVTDAMLSVAATTLADAVYDADLADGALFPRLRRLRELSRSIAIAVVREATRTGLARRSIPDDEVPAAVDREMWTPEYPELLPG
jgi:malate dehydrogenase (oxaloacetate-decarboxylating)